MIQLDPTSRIPVYQQIKEQMTGLIVMGVFPGEPAAQCACPGRRNGPEPQYHPEGLPGAGERGGHLQVGGKGCFVGGEENAAEATCRRAEAELREALRQARLAGVEKTTAEALVERCYGGTSDVKSRKPGKKV